MPKMPVSKKTVETLRHDDKRRNIPTAEYESLVEKGTQTEKKLRYLRNTDLDPQLVWRGKDEQDWSELILDAPPLYIQEKVHPKVLIDDLRRLSEVKKEGRGADRPLLGLQRHTRGYRQDGLLPARPELVQPHDPGRLTAGDGQLS